MNGLIIRLIQIIHFCVILSVLLVPFTNSNYFLMLHSVFIPFMILHWLTNNNTCVLTTAEKYLKNADTPEKEEECFTCKLINPIFDFTKDNEKLTRYIYIITIGMWLLSVLKLSLKYKNNEIKKFKDLFKF